MRESLIDILDRCAILEELDILGREAAQVGRADCPNSIRAQ